MLKGKQGFVVGKDWIQRPCLRQEVGIGAGVYVLRFGVEDLVCAEPPESKDVGKLGGDVEMVDPGMYVCDFRV